MSTLAPRLKPGSVLWLAAHDARLGARRFNDMFKGLAPRKRLAVLAVAFLALHAIAWPIATSLRAALAVPDERGLVVWGIAAALAFAVSWMTAQSLLGATRTIYIRSDLELLLSAPLPAGRILAARLISMSAENLASAGVFLLPIANAGALQGELGWLGLYPTLVAFAAAAAAAGIALALALLRLVGPRLMRTVAQVFATLIGATVALGIQAAAIMPSDIRQTLLGSMRSGEGSVPGASAVFADQAPWLPIDAAFGGLHSIAILLGLGLAATLAVAFLLGERFTAAALMSAGMTAVRRSHKTRRTKRFRAGLAAAVRQKEWRLLKRDPWIVGQLFLQILYTVPVAFILWRSGVGNGDPSIALAPSLCIIAAQVSASLAWIAISGEDAPEFMAAAPVSRGFVDACKLQVIGMIVGTLLAVPLLALAWVSPGGALATAAFCAVAGASAALLNLWHPTDGRRRAFMRRHAQSKLIGLLEHAMALLWAVTAAMALIGSVLAVVPAALALGTLYVGWRWLGRRPGVGAPKRGGPAETAAPALA